MTAAQAQRARRREHARIQRGIWRRDRWAPGSTVTLGPREAEFMMEITALGLGLDPSRLSPAAIDAARWAWLNRQAGRMTSDQLRSRIRWHIAKDEEQAPRPRPDGELMGTGAAVAVWDHSRAFAPYSKWRRVGPAERNRQTQVASNVLREALALEAGASPPPKPRRRRTAAPEVIGPAEANELRAFMAKHGAAIAGVIAGVDGDADQLRLAKAYRAVLAGEPGAQAAWTGLLGRLL